MAQQAAVTEYAQVFKSLSTLFPIVVLVVVVVVDDSVLGRRLFVNGEW